MIRFYKKLFWDEHIPEKKHKKIKAALFFNKWQLPVFAVLISKQENEQLEIISSTHLMERYYKKQKHFCVGIASNHDNACALVEKMVQECLQERGDVDLKAFFKRKKG